MEITEVNISKLDKAEVLAALYNNAKPQGLGFLHYTPELMTKEEAQKILDKVTDFDYLKGRVMKVDLSGDEIRTHLYNRDNGEGKAELVLASLKEKI